MSDNIEIKGKYVPGELLSESIPEASWVGGKGQRGLKIAEELWQKEMDSRNQIPGVRHPWVVEGNLGGEIVYRKHSIGGNVPADVEVIPQGKEDEVNYSVVSYKISA